MANAPVDKVGRRNTIIFLICTIVVILTIIFVFTWPFIRMNFDRSRRPMAGIPTPTQLDASGDVSLQGDGWSGRAIYHAKYTVWGLVVNKTSYENDASLLGILSPLDLGLAWGDMAKNNHLIKWTHGHRHLTANINSLYRIYIHEDDEKLFQQYSNNHLIFTSTELLEKAKSLELGDYVKIKGYLVDAEAHKTYEPAIKYELKTSLTRKDDGEDSCEVILVTKIEVLD